MIPNDEKEDIRKRKKEKIIRIITWSRFKT